MKIELAQRILIQVCCLSTLAIFPFFMDPINLPKLIILTVGTVLASMYIPIREILKTKISKWISFPIVFFVFSLFLASLFSKQTWHETFFGFWGRNDGLLTYLVFSSIFLIFSLKGSPRISQKFVNGIFTLGIILAPYAWLQFYRKDPINFFFPWYNQNDQIVLTLGNSNFASVFLAMTFAATFGRFIFEKMSLKFRIILAFVLAIHIRLIPLIDTQGKIVFAVAVSLLVGMKLLRYEANRIRVVGFVWAMLSILIGILGIIGLWGKGIFAGVLSDNVRALVDRSFAWRAARDMLFERPWTGFGIDSFNNWYRRFRSAESLEIRQGNPYIGYDNAHNTFLQFGATGGFFLLLSFIAFVIVVSIFALKSWQRDDSNMPIIITFWFIYVIQSLTSMDQMGVAVWGWASAGIILGNYFSNLEDIGSASRANSSMNANTKTLRKENRRTLRLKLIGPLLAFTLFYPMSSNENIIFRNISKLPYVRDSVEYSSTLENLSKAGMKSRSSELRLTVISYLGKGKMYEEALELAVETTEKFPDSFGAWDFRSKAEATLGMYDEALASRKKSLRLDPLNSIAKSLELELENWINNR